MSERRPVTVVTGGGRGIGAATAVALARAGHDVAVGAVRDAGAAEEVVGRVRAAGGRAVAVLADVTDPVQVDRLFASAASALGPVTGLVCSAGATLHLGDLADTPVEVVRRVLDLNLLGTVLCARRGAQVLSTARGGPGGAVVTLSSAAATLGSPHEYVHYAAAKAGVEALTLGLAKELAGEGVRVNAGGARHRAHEDPRGRRRPRAGRPGRRPGRAGPRRRGGRGRRGSRVAAVGRRLVRDRRGPAGRRRAVTPTTWGPWFPREVSG